MISQFKDLLVVQFKEFFREPAALFWSFIFPILISLVLGFAFSDKPTLFQKAAVVLSTQDSTQLKSFLQSKCEKNKLAELTYQLITDNQHLGKTTTEFIPCTWAEAETKMKRGEISIILTEEQGQVQYHFDPANSAARLSYISISGLLEGKSLVSDPGMIKPLESKGTRYIDFLIPGLLTMGIMSSTLWGISYGLIEKRSKKLLRRMVATPMKKSMFMLSMFFSRYVFTILEIIILLIFSKLVFGVSMQGSWLAFAAIIISGSFFFMGLAILLASRTSNPQVGNGIISAFTMPMMLFSGIFFSYSNFPDFMAGIVKYLPLTLFTDALRSIINEGSGMAQVMLPFCLLSLTGIITFMVGLKLYKWY